jgi:hypothetical protein
MNLFSFLKKPAEDFVTVATLRCGYNFLSKGDDKLGTVPLVWEAHLFENSEGKRKIVEHGNLKVNRSIRKSLREWKKHSIVISIVPNWHHIVTGGAPYVLYTTP